MKIFKIYFTSLYTLGYVHELGVCRTCLTISGLWSDTHFTESKQLLTTIIYSINIFIIVAFINIAQTVKLIMIWGDFDEMSQIISTADFSIGIVVIKMLVFRSYRTGILLIISLTYSL